MSSSGGLYESFATASFAILQQVGSNSLSLSYNSTPGSHNTLSGSFSGFVGEQLVLNESMELTTYVSGSYQFTHPGTSTVDFSHTIQFFGDSATAGADAGGQQRAQLCHPVAAEYYGR